MSFKQFLFIAFMVSALAISPARAQDFEQNNNELSGIIGRTFIGTQGIPNGSLTDNHIRFGKGLTFEINYARRVFVKPLFSLSLELPVVMNLDEDIQVPTNFAPAQYRSLFVTPSARVNFLSDQQISPWISLGAGLGHFSADSTLIFGGPNPGSTGSFTGVIQMGLGLDVKLLHRFSVRGEARDFWAGTPNLNVNVASSRQHNFLLGGGIIYHF